MELVEKNHLIQIFSSPPCLKTLTMGQVLQRLLDIFYTKKLDIVVIGLENR